MKKFLLAISMVALMAIFVLFMFPKVADAALRGNSQIHKSLMGYINGVLVVFDDGSRPPVVTTKVVPVYNMLPGKIKVDNSALVTVRNPGTNDYRIGNSIQVYPHSSAASGAASCESIGNDAPCSYNDEGDTRWPCSFAHFAYDDPIVYPGQPNKSHLHAFFGNTQTDYLTTPANIRTRSGSTCPGGAYNKTAYWVPGLVNKYTGKVKVPYMNEVYYKSEYDSPTHTAQIQNFPVGLRMITCSPNNTVPCDASNWDCGPNGHGLPGGGTRHTLPSRADCPTSVTDASTDINNLLLFPRCWDGVNLDGNPAIPGDHATHMANPMGNGPDVDGDCPADHPVRFARISYNVRYTFTSAENLDDWYLSSDDPNGVRGATAHGDWFMGWDRVGTAATGYEDIFDTIRRTCITAFVDCHAYHVGPFKAGDTGATQWRILQ